jgi:hypothetical protein
LCWVFSKIGYHKIFAPASNHDPPNLCLLSR